MNELMTMEAANLFCGAEPTDITPSNHLSLAELKLPTFEEQYNDHRAGGAPVTIEIDSVFARLECTFSLAGWTPQVASLVASWEPTQNMFFAYGVVRVRSTGQAIQAVAEMYGRLGRADPAAFSRGSLQHWNYAIRGLTYYRLTLGQYPMYDWDFQTNRLIVGGDNRNADLNRLLNTGSTGLPVASAPVASTTGETA